jgi:hypothetical protein
MEGRGDRLPDGHSVKTLPVCVVAARSSRPLGFVADARAAARQGTIALSEPAVGLAIWIISCD